MSCHLCLLISCDSLVFCFVCLIAWYLYFLLCIELSYDKVIHRVTNVIHIFYIAELFLNKFQCINIWHGASQGVKTVQTLGTGTHTHIYTFL